MSDDTPLPSGMAAPGPDPRFNPADEGWMLRDDEPGLIVLLGPLWQREESGGLEFGFLAEAKHLNRRGVVHGGMLMTFADQALGLAAREATGQLPQATIQLDTHFIAAVAPGEFIVARPQVLRRTRSILFMRGILSVGERIVASAQGTWKVLGAG